MQSQSHANTQQDTPQLTEALLDDLLNPAMSPILICQIHGLTLPQLRKITQSADYQAAIEAIQSINAARTPTIESTLHLQSLATLQEAADLAHQLALTQPASPTLHFGGVGEVSRRDGGGLPPSPSLLGEGRGEGSHASSPTPSKFSQSSLHLRTLESLRKSATTLLRETRPTPRRPRRPNSGWRGGVVFDSSTILKSSKNQPIQPDPQVWHAVCDTSPAGIWCSRRNTDAPTEARHELRHPNLSIRSTHLHPPTRRDVREPRKPWNRRV